MPPLNALSAHMAKFRRIDSRSFVRAMLRIGLVNGLVLAALMELCSFLYILAARPLIYRYQKLPTYLEWTWEDSYLHKDPLGPHLLDTTLPWCTVHPSDGRYHQFLEVRDVIMQFNAHGFRGQLPTPADSSRTIFLGDSFTEGWGLEEEETIPQQYSTLSGTTAINLGTSSFGSTQASLLYDSMGSHYAHQQVVVLLYLSNDFADIDIRTRLADTAKKTYCVYRSKPEDLATLTFVSSPTASPRSRKRYEISRQEGFQTLERIGLKTLLRDQTVALPRRLADLTYSMRVLSLLYERLQTLRNHQSTLPEELDYDAFRLNILQYDLDQIIHTARAQGARTFITNLPSWPLLDAIGNDPRTAQKYQQLEDTLTNMITRAGGQYHSFYQYLSAKKVDKEQLFLWRDGHYTPYGARHVALFLQESLDKKR